MLKLLVELFSSSSKDLVVSTLRLTHLLMLKYEWRVSFATEGGVKAILSCMLEFSTVTQVQQLALAVSNTEEIEHSAGGRWSTHTSVCELMSKIHQVKTVQIHFRCLCVYFIVCTLFTIINVNRERFHREQRNQRNSQKEENKIKG